MEEGKRGSWSSLFRRPTVESALREIAGWTGSPDEIVLEVSLWPGGEIIEHRGNRAPAGAPRADVVAGIDGAPPWTLRIGKVGKTPVPVAEADRIGEALSAWRAARVERARVEARVEARGRELDLLQKLSRDAAEARTVPELFQAAAAVLHEGARVEVIVVAHALSGTREGAAHIVRPTESSRLLRLAAQAGESLGWSGDRPKLTVFPLAVYDEGRGPSERVGSDDAVLLPLSRRGEHVASLALAPAEQVGERHRRLVYGTVNQVAMHLDRILTVEEAERGRFRSILDSMPQAVLLMDAKLTVLRANRAAEKLLSTMEPGKIGEPFRRLGDLDLAELTGRVIEDGEPVGTETRSGERFFHVTVSALTAATGTVEGLVTVIADVSEARRLEEHLRHSEKLSSLGQMLSGIAHELNNPLTAVVGYAQLVGDLTVDAELKRRLAVVRKESERCQRIVQNLLRFARRYEPERKSFSLNDTVLSVLSLMAYQFRSDGIEVRSALDRDLPVVLGDPHQIQQAVLNLCTNAHHALRAQGRGGTVSVRTERLDDDLVVLEVADDGPGIPEEIRSRVFDPFFTTKPAEEGSGLGLSLVSGIVASHGGSIRVTSGDSGGARFRIEIPVGDPKTPDLPAPPEESPSAMRSVSARILVVDDEEAVASVICEALAADGHRVEPAADGNEALCRLAEEEFDLVVSDLRMPGMGAGELRDRIEKIRPGYASRMLLTTGDTVSRDPDVLARRLRTEILHKPFDLDQLRRAVRLRLRDQGDR